MPATARSSAIANDGVGGAAALTSNPLDVRRSTAKRKHSIACLTYANGPPPRNAVSNMTAARVMILDDVPVDRPVHETLRRVLRARLADAYFRPLPSVIVDVGLDSTKVAS